MNENWISVQHNTQSLSTMNWTCIGLLQISPPSIRVQFTGFGLNFRHMLYHNLASGLMTANDTSQFDLSWTP